MKDYAKMINTVNAIQKAFGSKEFTAHDYKRALGSNIDCYCTSKVCNTDPKNIMVKKVREEDFIAVRKVSGKKVVATRYFYEVNTDFIKQLKESLCKEVEEMYGDIQVIKNQIAEKEKRIRAKKEQIEVFEAILNA